MVELEAGKYSNRRFYRARRVNALRGAIKRVLSATTVVIASKLF